MNLSSSIPENIRHEVEVFKKGLVDLISEKELIQKLQKSHTSKKPLRIKYGVDPSASDIHLGHTVPLFKLRALQELGHEIVFLIGDFTARIGDPSHKSETRKMLTREEVEANAKTYTDQVFKILDKKKTTVVYNSEWLDKLKTDEFLKLMGHTTVHRMIERDDFKKRFDEKRSISLLEFIYPLLQAYDSVVLKSDIELGGTDQKFNLLMGRELQRDHDQEPQVVMTLPILEGTDGVQKMSKSLGNAIGINMAPVEMFGKIMSIPDKLIVPFYEYVSMSTPEDIKRVREGIESGKNPRELKAELARRIVSFYHTARAAQEASDAFDRQFRDKQIPDEIREVVIKNDYPDSRGTILQISQEASDLGLSSGEIRRLVTQGAVKVNGKKVEDIQEPFDVTQPIVAQYGKRLFRRFLPKARS